MKNETISIDGRLIGPGQPPYVICELSGNHNGSLERALELVEQAAKTGCDAIKIQTYTPDTMTIPCDSDDFRITGGLWDGYSLYDLYVEAHTPLEWHPALFEKARELGVTMFSTPFDEAGADFLEGLDVPAYKIASFEATDLDLIAHVAKKGKPLIISTGLADLAEIHAAVSTARNAGCEQLILLHCVSSYPAPSDQSNVRTVANLAETFDVVSGLSDHTLGSATAVASIALGASVIEKHFTLARADGGPDAEFSLEPNEFESLCQDCKSAWVSLGQVEYGRTEAEKANLAFRRSLYVVKPVKEGEEFTRENVRKIRPGFGMEPKEITNVLGKCATQTLQPGTPLQREHVK